VRNTRLAVAIPARNEAALIGDCLAALAAQRDAPAAEIVLLLNNTTDDSAAAAQAAATRHGLRLHLLDIELPPERACAGWARKLAMDHAADLVGTDGVLLCTDADGRADPGWMAANLRAMSAGAQAVFGRAEIDPDDARAIPAILHEDDARECAYGRLLDALANVADPDPYDPWPRHDERPGASIAVTAEAYARAGGIPPVSLAEDRHFYLALRRIDARIRHAPDAVVVVSGRIAGRAPGGMADTIRRRLAGPDPLLDPRLEPAGDALRRARLRAASRAVWREEPGSLAPLARALRLPVARLRAHLARPYFGAAWEAIEEESPTLRRRTVPAAELAAQTAIAEMLLAAERFRSAGEAGPADTPLSAPAA
jgi:GT2 family glycosyltransferase